MTLAIWSEPVTLEGKHLRLEPLTPQHAPALHRHYSPEMFTYLSRGEPENDTLEAMTAHLERMCSLPNRMNWAIRMPSGDIAGRISYSTINISDRWLEVGTMLAQPFWGTAVNPETKLLLLTRAFETLHAVRVQFRVDARNLRSQASMEKLGAVREGVLRKYQLRPDGFSRDSVIYSVLNEEWLEVKAGLQHWLERF